MSRSYKKPYVTDQNRGQPQRGKAKRDAARAVRHTKTVGCGGEFKKHSCSLSIRDWSFHCPNDPKAKRK